MCRAGLCPVSLSNQVTKRDPVLGTEDETRASAGDSLWGQGKQDRRGHDLSRVSQCSGKQETEALCRGGRPRGAAWK